MIKFSPKNKKQKGYAMLFTVILVSAISIITAGIINATYKQVVLSSLAKNSQLAFYQADMASDCALYADQVLRLKEENKELFTEGGGGSWSCGEYDLFINPISKDDYDIFSKSLSSSTEPCFRIEVRKTISKTTDTKIKAKGYNVCNLYNQRTVERTIEINYSE